MGDEGGHVRCGNWQPTPKRKLRDSTASQTVQSLQSARYDPAPAPVDPRRCALPCLKRMASPGKGCGLFTLMLLPIYTIIGVYTGRVITDSNEAVPAHFEQHTMSANDDGSYRIVADPECDVLSSVNEPDEHHRANLHLQFVRIEVGTRRDTVYIVVYVTAHEIPPNTELLVSYGFSTNGGAQHFKRHDYRPGGPPETRELPALSEQLTGVFRDGFCRAQELSPVDIAYTYGAVEEDEYADVRSDGLEDLETTMREMNRRACETNMDMNMI